MTKDDDETRNGPARPSQPQRPQQTQPQPQPSQPSPQQTQQQQPQLSPQQQQPPHAQPSPQPHSHQPAQPQQPHQPPQPPPGHAEVVSRFVEQFAAQLVEAGMPRMPARIFTALLASDSGALTSAELGERLRVSPAAVSGAVRYLTQQHMVTREREPGTRRDIFRVHDNQWYEALGNRDGVLKRWESALRDGVTNLGPDTPAGRRLSETLAFFEFIEAELAGMMARWRVHRETLYGKD